MGKIGTHEEAGQSMVSWWDLPLSRKVAHFEALIDALAAAAASSTERPPASTLMSFDQKRRRRAARRAASAQQFDFSAHLRALHRGSSDDSEYDEDDAKSPASLMAQMTAEVERIRKRRDRRHRRRMTTQWGKVDPTMWPFDMKVNFFADLACETRLREAIDNGWKEHKRAREEAARSPEIKRRTGAQRRRHTKAERKQKAEQVERMEVEGKADDCADEVDLESDAMKMEMDGQPDHHDADVESAQEDELEPEIADEGAASSYVGEVQIIRPVNKNRKRKMRRNAHKKRLRLSKEAEREKKKRKKEKEDKQESNEHSGSTYIALNGKHDLAPEKQQTDEARKTKKWEEPKGRVRREITKMWTNKHVKRGVFRFERHLADRDVLGMECLDWTKRQCGSSHVGGYDQVLLPFFSHTTNTLGDDSTLVVVGGKDAKGKGTSAVRFLETSSMEWSLPATVSGLAPAFLFGHSACRVGRSLYLFGGYDQRGLSPHIYRLDISPSLDKVTWSILHFTAANGDQVPLSSFYRIGHSLVRRDNHLFLFGGHNGKLWCNDMYAFNLETLTWRMVPTIGTPPSPRGFHTATIVGSNMLVYGGTNVQRTFADTHVLDLDTLVWTTVVPQQPVTAIPSGRHSHAAARVGESVFILGGRTKGGVASDCWSFNIYTKKWIRMKEKNESSSQGALGLSSHTMTLLRSNKLVVVGGKGTTSLSGDVWISSTTRLPLPSSASTKIIDYDQLELREEVGRGSFAKVIRASLRDSRGNNVECAVKKLRKMARKNEENELSHFKQEVSLLSKLDHPNVVKLVGVCTKPRCIVTEFMSGGSLSDVLRQKGSLLENDSALLTSIALDIAKGGQYLHHQQVIHRDIKSHNILLDENFSAKIADLGVSRISTDTSTMTCVGSAQWTAPEILRHQPYDQAVDVYSYGIVLWELLSGCQPYAHLSRLEAAVAVASSQLRPEIFAHWPEQWTTLMQRCWHERPSERPTFDQIVDYIQSHF